MFHEYFRPTNRVKFNLISEKDVTNIIGEILKYLQKNRGMTTTMVADSIQISVSYLYKLKSLKSALGFYNRKSYLIILLKTFSISTRRDPSGRFYIHPELDNSYYIIDCFSYIYLKETSDLEIYKTRIDIVENTVKLIDDDENTIFLGIYEDSFSHTVCNLTNKDKSNSFDNSEDELGEYREEARRVLIASDLRLNNPVEFVKEKDIFGFCTRIVDNIKVQSGRTVLSIKPFKEINDTILTYLCSEKFHQFNNFNLNIANVEEAEYYVRKFNETNKHIQIEIPKELSGAYQQFLSFFSDYVEIIKGKEIKFDVLKSKDGITIDLSILNKSTKMSEIEGYLKEYIEFTQQNIDNLKLNIETYLSNTDIDLFILDLKGQINTFKHKLDIAALKNKMLEQQNDKYFKIIESLTNKDTSIHFQLISGGEQQFADKIKN